MKDLREIDDIVPVIDYAAREQRNAGFPLRLITILSLTASACSWATYVLAHQYSSKFYFTLYALVISTVFLIFGCILTVLVMRHIFSSYGQQRLSLPPILLTVSQIVAWYLTDMIFGAF